MGARMTSPHGCGKSQGGDRPENAPYLSHFRSLSISALEGRGRDHGFANWRCDYYLCDPKLPHDQLIRQVHWLAMWHATTASHGRLPHRARYPPTSRITLNAYRSPRRRLYGMTS